MVAREFKLPDPGEGLVEAEIVSWRVAVGDTVKINDILVEIETSKSIVELPSPYAGTVGALLVAEGDTVEVGRPIISVEDGVQAPGSVSDPVPETPEAPAGEASDGRVAMLVGYGPRTAESKRRPRKNGHPPEPVAAEAHEQFAETFSATGPVLAKPPVRKLAKDLGIDLTRLTGTGPGGVITRDDVQATAPTPERPSTSSGQRPSTSSGQRPSTSSGQSVDGPAPAEGDVRIPIKGVRKATAAAMVSSAFTAPHVTEWVTCDVSATVELVVRLNERREFRGVKISPLLIVAKAVCLALSRTPQLNSFWDAPANEIVLKSAVNLGIAAATPRGLVVPNIKDAQSLSLLELAAAINDIVATAREGRTQPATMAGGTFTITNVGTFGVDAGTPILNPGESGILCIGQIARRPWVVGTGDDERIEPRWVTTLAVSFDHRLADGEQGSIFLATVAQTLADPGLALLF